MSDKKTIAQRVEKAYPHPVLKERLNSYARQTGQSKSHVMCEALKIYLSDKNIIRGKQ
jgi:hypothetical protein